MEDRFKFVDDLSTIEIINLLTIGLSSLNMKNQIPSDLPTHGQIVDNNSTKSQQYLNQLDKWSEEHKMIISQKKTKAMIINYTDNHQFTTRLQLKGENIEVVDKIKLLGTIVTDRLSWNENCEYLIKKVNARMALLRGVLNFGGKNHEMVHLWKTYCRSVLEQSCVVWSSSLTQENINDLERTQKTFCKLVLRQNYKNYNNALLQLNLESLKERRETLCLTFAKSGIKNNNLRDLLPEQKKKNRTRNHEKYEVKFANTERLKRSSIVYMQNLLNS